MITEEIFEKFENRIEIDTNDTRNDIRITMHISIITKRM